MCTEGEPSMSGIVYILPTLLGAILLYSNEFKHNDKLRKIIIYFFELYYCGLLALRASTVGTDTPLYTKMYKWIANFGGTLNDLINSGDAYSKNPGWTAFFWEISNLFGESIKVYLLISGLVVAILFFSWINYNRIDIRAQLILYVLLCYLPAFNVNRTFIAVGLSLWSATFALKNKKILAIIFAGLAISVHNIAIVILLVDVLFCLKWTRKRLIIACLALIVSGTLIESFMSIFTGLFTDYEGYLTKVNDTVGGKNVILQVVFILVACYLWQILKKNKLEEAEYQLVSKIFIVTFFEIVIGIVGINTWYLQRLLEFLKPSIIISYPVTLKYQSKYKKYYIATCLIILIVNFLYTIILNKGDILPYHTWIGEN